jgi:hypothetical protein
VQHSFSRRKFLAFGGAATLPGWSTIAQPSLAAANWLDHRTHGPFQVQATFPLASFSLLFQELSALELELQRTLAVPPAGQRVDVYLLDDQRSHRELLARLFPRVPYRRALYVQRAGQGSVYAYRHPELAVDLRHECTHALLHSNLPMVPLWLDEGLAEYFEMPALGRSFDHPHLAELRWNMRFGMVRGMEELEACHDLSDMGAVEYRFAWAWVHYMLHGPLPAHRALVHYLGDIRQGNPPGLLSERFDADGPNLKQQLAWHFKNWRR